MDGYIGSWTFVAQYCGYVFLGYEGGWTLVIEYFFFIFVSALGLIQLIAAKSRLNGISFFNRRIWGYTFGTAAVIISFCCFFILRDRSVLTFDANQQLFWFCLGTLCSFLFTFTISHLIKRKRLKTIIDETSGTEEGIDKLKYSTYWSAISQFIKAKDK